MKKLSVEAKTTLHSQHKIDAADFQHRGVLSIGSFSLFSFLNICSSCWKLVSFVQHVSIIHPSVFLSVLAPLPHVSSVTFSLSPPLIYPILVCVCVWESVCLAFSVVHPLLTQWRHGKCTHFIPKLPQSKYLKCRCCYWLGDDYSSSWCSEFNMGHSVRVLYLPSGGKHMTSAGQHWGEREALLKQEWGEKKKANCTVKKGRVRLCVCLLP